MKQHIPNLLTLSNAFAGSVALVFIFQQDWQNALLCIFSGLLADFLDGGVARLLGVSSELGKQLDSLADMITFGVVPGAIMYQLLLKSCLASDWSMNLAFTAFLIPVFACLRLARFNLDSTQSEDFIGLPTPAATFFVIGLLLIDWQQLMGANGLAQPATLLILVLLISWLMVSPIRLFGLKFKHFQWRGNAVRFVFLGLSATLLIVLQLAALVPIIGLYILMSLVSTNRRTDSSPSTRK